MDKKQWIEFEDTVVSLAETWIEISIGFDIENSTQRRLPCGDVD